ncbi:MAG: sugar phosphate isomerase/epimerase [Actinomycetota bacterium]|nr:sugar phosphate isomerase/epimerase [Actinomycetota bacterium]
MRLSVITDEISQDLDRALGVCADLGIRTVELRAVGGTNIVSHDLGSLQRIKSTLADGDFDVCAISSPFLKCHLYDGGAPQGAMHSATPASREEQWGILESSLRVARLLGAPVVRAFSFWRAEKPEEVREEVADVLSEAARRAESAGLVLGLENEHTCNIGTGIEAGRVLGRIASPSLGVIWDPGNEAMLGSRPFPDGYGHIRGRIAHVHLKDVDVEGNWVRVGAGVIDYPGQLRALAEDGYAGVLSLETHYEVAEGGLEGATRESVAALRELCGRAGVELQS